ncbi:MAG: anti-sigma F factor [Lachnospira sp.]|nr:anti-sigma F factor [Lachnospira sp.]
MKNKADNSMEIIFDAKSENESFARVVAAAFCTRLDPTVEEIADIKTAVSEAVTNSIVHGYDGREGQILMRCSIVDRDVIIEIEDEGVGIENVERAMEPLYTTKPEQERSGMGFSFMEAFMDELKVTSGKNSGTTVTMKKRIGVEN